MSSKANDLVLVTGCSGYIATWVTKYALDAGYRVRGTVRDPGNQAKVKFLKDLPGADERLELVSLDLENSDQATFDKVLEGCTLVAHTASPFPAKVPKDENELIKPAVNGTLSVLRAAAKSPSVRSVVVTSSVAAVGSSKDDKPRGEQDWTDIESPDTGAYVKSKTLAERAAWEFYKENSPSWSLCTINPSFVVGPCIGTEKTTSAEVGIRLLNRQMPVLPKLSFGLVDVRDVARAHLNVLEAPKEAVNGRRFILCHQSAWLKEIAEIMDKDFKHMDYHVPQTEAPYFVLWLASLFDSSLKLILPGIGKMTHYENGPSKQVIGINYRPLEATLADYGHSLIFHGFVHKQAGYKPPFEGWTPALSEKSMQ